MNRRSLLASAAATSGAALLAPLGRLLGAEIPAERRRLLQVNGYAVDAETPLDVLTTYLTPNDLFFVRHHWVPQLPDKATWKLAIDGEVSHPLELTLADLKKLPLERVQVRVRHGKRHAEDCKDCTESESPKIDRFERTIRIEGALAGPLERLDAFALPAQELLVIRKAE